ncbi:MAG: DUF4384 domain-containing protein [Melioribacteraceae bacterium]|nr:DUF4384 domain-containing protein [Melioribacteraceae bacterium]MCF8356148.1 DUF4384 domain-containing protein [Melioribacteraceae bacterium]MCF8395622.1 DUF4384 domain-containing protein [Melioribacteraceae bacterium]MCF8420873.1 DUF4384 domain-containing protein [Melioribacteraceae bacterium]
MKNYIIIFLVIILISVITSAQDTNEVKVKSKIGIMLKSGDSFTRLKTNDRLVAGDQIRIFVQPLSAAYTYVIFSDDKEAALLNANDFAKEVKANDIIILPSEEEFYAFDDKSESAKISVICIPERMKELEALFSESGSASLDKWTSFESILEEEVKSDISDKTDKPFTMAGNVRGVNDSFHNKLQLFTGDKLVLKKYAVEIKK